MIKLHYEEEAGSSVGFYGEIQDFECLGFGFRTSILGSEFRFWVIVASSSQSSL